MRPKTAGSTLPVDNQRASSPPPPSPPLGPHPRHTAGPTPPSSSPSRGANAALTSASSAALAASLARAFVSLASAATARRRSSSASARTRATGRGDRRRRRERPPPPRAPPSKSVRSPFEVIGPAVRAASEPARGERVARLRGDERVRVGGLRRRRFFLLRRSPRQRRRKRAQTPRPTRRGGFRVRQHRAAERERGRRGDARRAIVRRRVVLGFPAAPVRAIAFSFAARVCVSVSAAALGGKKTLERG